MKKITKSIKKYLSAANLILILVWGCNFLVVWRAVALASSCFGFAFAWKYVWLVWFILIFVAEFFGGRGSK